MPSVRAERDVQDSAISPSEEAVLGMLDMQDLAGARSPTRRGG